MKRTNSRLLLIPFPRSFPVPSSTACLLACMCNSILHPTHLLHTVRSLNICKITVALDSTPYACSFSSTQISTCMNVLPAWRTDADIRIDGKTLGLICACNGARCLHSHFQANQPITIFHSAGISNFIIPSAIAPKAE